MGLGGDGPTIFLTCSGVKGDREVSEGLGAVAWGGGVDGLSAIVVDGL